MFDPAAMGTLIIGLNAVVADEQPDRRRRRVPAPRPARRGIRVALARRLRQVAAALESSTVREAANEPAG